VSISTGTLSLVLGRGFWDLAAALEAARALGVERLELAVLPE
jgi:hypothetical protein